MRYQNINTFRPGGEQENPHGRDGPVERDDPGEIEGPGDMEHPRIKD